MRTLNGHLSFLRLFVCLAVLFVASDPSSIRLSYPRLQYCQLSYSCGPKPVPPPRFPVQPLHHSLPSYTLDYQLEYDIIEKAGNRIEKQKKENRERQNRQDQYEAYMKQIQLEKEKEKERERAAVEQKKKEDAEQEKLRAAYNQQKAAVEAYQQQQQQSQQSQQQKLPVAPPVVNRSSVTKAALPYTATQSAASSVTASSSSSSSSSSFVPNITPPPLPAFSSRPSSFGASSSSLSSSAQAVAAFEAITGVSDPQSSALLLSILKDDVDHAVNIYYSDEHNPTMTSAIQKALSLQEQEAERIGLGRG